LREEAGDIGVDQLRAALNAATPNLTAARTVLMETSIRNRGPSVDEIMARVQRELDAFPDALTYLPPDWARIQDLLNRSSVPAEQRINEHMATYLRGLQNPQLIVEILREAATRAWAAERSISWGLREMARENGAARGIPSEVIPHQGGALF